MEEAEPFRMLELLSNGVADVCSNTSLEADLAVGSARQAPAGQIA
jgi:hypothetical protein